MSTPILLIVSAKDIAALGFAEKILAAVADRDDPVAGVQGALRRIGQMKKRAEKDQKQVKKDFKK